MNNDLVNGVPSSARNNSSDGFVDTQTCYCVTEYIPEKLHRAQLTTVRVLKKLNGNSMSEWISLGCLE